MRYRIALVASAALALTFGGALATAQADTATAPVASARAAAVSTSTADGIAALNATCGNTIFSPDGAAFVCFNPTGEHLFVCDNAPDGHHPVALFVRSTSPSVLRRADYTGGSGSCGDFNLADIPESGWIQYAACNAEGDTLLDCSGFTGRVSARG